MYTWRHTHGQVEQYRICKRFVNEERMDIQKQKGNKRQCRLYKSRLFNFLMETLPVLLQPPSSSLISSRSAAEEEEGEEEEKERVV